MDSDKLQNPGQKDSGTRSDKSHPTQDKDQSNAVAAAIISFTNEYRTRDKENQCQQNKNTRWVKAGTISVALYTVITFVLLCVTRRGVEVTRRSVEVSQRAWLIATEFAEISQPLKEEDRTISVPLIVENSGKTPAIYIQGQGSILCTRSPQEPLNWPHIVADLKDTKILQFILGPGQRTGLVTVDLPLPSGCLMDQVLANQVSLLTYGYINYWDEFGTPRGVLICGIYSPVVKRFEFCGHDNLPW